MFFLSACSCQRLRMQINLIVARKNTNSFAIIQNKARKLKKVYMYLTDVYMYLTDMDLKVVYMYY